MKKPLLILFILFSVFVPSLTSAGFLDPFDQPIVPCGRAGQPSCTLCHFLVLLGNLFNFAGSFLIIIALTLITVGGVLYIVSGAFQNLKSVAKNIITGTITGFALFFLAWLIVFAVLKLVSVNQSYLGSGGTWYTFSCESKSAFDNIVLPTAKPTPVTTPPKIVCAPIDNGKRCFDSKTNGYGICQGGFCTTKPGELGDKCGVNDAGICSMGTTNVIAGNCGSGLRCVGNKSPAPTPGQSGWTQQKEDINRTIFTNNGLSVNNPDPNVTNAGLLKDKTVSEIVAFKKDFNKKYPNETYVLTGLAEQQGHSGNSHPEGRAYDMRSSGSDHLSDYIRKNFTPGKSITVSGRLCKTYIDNKGNYYIDETKKTGQSHWHVTVKQ